MVNDYDNIDEFLDLHGQNKNFSVATTRSRLEDVENRVKSGQINPNCGDRMNHVYKISCGAGKHSIGVPVLK